MTGNQKHKQWLPPDAVFWLLPLVALGGAAAVHTYFTGSVDDYVFFGAPLVGIALTVVCILWTRGMKRVLEEELLERSNQLDESRAFLQNLVDSSPDAIVLSNLGGVVTFASKAAERILGYERRELIGSEASRFYRGGREGARRVRDMLLANEGRISGERMDLVAQGGEEIPVSLSASVLRVGEGPPLGIMAVFQDLRQRIGVEEKELQAERLRLLGECVAGVAHELNNPLTGVIGYLQLATRVGIPPEAERTVEKASREASRMTNTIRSLLDFVRQHAPERMATDLNALVSQVVDFQKYQLGVLDVELEAEYGELPHALVDPHQIRQVLMNLVKNAGDAIESLRRPGTILIRTRYEDGTFWIEVEDDGPGVSPSAMKHVFEEFFTTKPSGRGTGLGLSICRQIVEAHGGRIWLAADAERGARFCVELPVPVVPAEKIAGIRRPGSTPALRILVADDEEAIREYLGMVLLEAGHEVLEASCGEGALELALDRSVDVAFVDLKMPDMAGEECAARLCALQPELEGRVVLMSGDDRGTVNGALFLAKPMSPDDILDAVGRAWSVEVPR